MRKIMITGAGSGLGAMLAKLYIENGDFVIFVGRTLERLQSKAVLFDEGGLQSAVYSCDVSSHTSVMSLKESIKTDHGSIDILINCAGIGYFGPLSVMTSDQLESMFQVNTFGTIYMSQAFIPLLTQRLMNIISTAGLKGKNNESFYVASKFAVRGFTESLQVEFKDEEITITAVYMGGMATHFWDGSNHINDMSRLKSAESIAKEILEAEEKSEEIIV